MPIGTRTSVMALENSRPQGRQKGSLRMKRNHLEILVTGIFATTVFALAAGVAAQTPPPPGPSPAAKSPMAAPMTGHHMDSTTAAKHEADMKAECQAMMAKKQEMQDKLQAMDATLDKLVAEMNAAQSSKTADAMERPMAAVITELVAQRKAQRAMMMEMQPAMAEHMMQHMQMKGTKGAMDCPMMSKAEEKKPTS